MLHGQMQTLHVQDESDHSDTVTKVSFCHVFPLIRFGWFDVRLCTRQPAQVGAAHVSAVLDDVWSVTG